MAEEGEPAVSAQQDDNGRTDGPEAGTVDHTDTEVVFPTAVTLLSSTVLTPLCLSLWTE